jgi:hypothetical protein
MAEMINAYKNLDGKYEAKTQPGKTNTYLLTPWSRVLLEKLTVCS